MKPRVRFADPELTLVNRLVTEWAARADVFKPATVTSAFPKNALTGNATHVQVELDGAIVAGYPATERATVRFTCWSAPAKPTNAKDVASITQAFVSSHPGDADVWSTLLLTGRIKGIDPDTRNNFVTFTARVNMRPVSL